MDEQAAGVAAGQEAVDNGIQVMDVQRVFMNWLPFTEEEADFLAFGSKVPVDALPAVCAAIRQLPGHSQFHIAEQADLRLVR